jgi:hypothetical protein
MFGSLDGFPGYVTESGTTFSGGWTASEWRAVKKFVYEGCKLNVEIWGEMHDESELPYFAYQVAEGQGEDWNGTHPWNRGFMYGDIDGSAEWLMQVNFDAAKGDDPNDYWEFSGKPYDRILIGRPIWIRTKIERDMRIYARYTSAERRSWPPPVQKDRTIRGKWLGRRR